MPQKAEGLLTLRDGHSAEDEVVIVAASRVQDLVTSILIRKGATDDDAIAQAALLVEGDLRGRHSHGIRRLPVLVGRLRNGLVRSGSEPVHRWQTDVVLAVGGASGSGLSSPMSRSGEREQTPSRS